MAVIPQRKSGEFTLPYLWSKYGQTPGFRMSLSSPGYSVNNTRPFVTEENPIVNNPYGSQLQVAIREGLGRFEAPIILQGGQSYNFLTGQYSDPNISATTASRLNAALNFRKVEEVGLSQASKTSTRGQQGVLATLDEMYWGQWQTKVEAGSQLTGFQLANQQGMSEGGQKTILGSQGAAKKTVTPAKVRALT